MSGADPRPTLRDVLVKHYSPAGVDRLTEWQMERVVALEAAVRAWLSVVSEQEQEAAARIATTLHDLSAWDMLSLTPTGRGAATADAPWARAMLLDAQEALAELLAARGCLLGHEETQP